jgi:general secretion pathway protein G
MSRKTSKKTKKNSRRRGFSLIELVIVVVIIAIIGAIAIPRMSRGAAGASDSALKGDLAQLRSAIDLYAGEHNNNFPDLVTSTNALTEFTDDSGDAQAAKDSTHIYGPYLRSIPTLPVGPATFKGTDTVVDGTSGNTGAAPGAWFYNKNTGVVQANIDSSIVDTTGTAYSTY